MDQFETYRKLLAVWLKDKTKSAMRKAIEREGIILPLDLRDNPISGYWRKKRHETGKIEPLGIWREDNGEGALIIYWGEDEARTTHLDEHYVWSPVPWEWWRDAMDGKPWPDEDEAMARERDEPGIGHNEPRSELEVVKDEIESAKAGIEKYDKIADDNQFSASQSKRARLLELHRKADKLRDELKRPYHEAGKKIDAEWQPVVKDAKAAADRINRAQNIYENEKEAQRRAEQARLQREADERRRAEEEAVAKSKAEGTPLPAWFGEQKEPEPPAPVAPSTSVKGAYGRAANIKTKEVATGINDVASFAIYMRADVAFLDYCIKRAQKILDDTGEVAPGVTVETQRRVA